MNMKVFFLCDVVVDAAAAHSRCVLLTGVRKKEIMSLFQSASQAVNAFGFSKTLLGHLEVWSQLNLHTLFNFAVVAASVGLR